MFIVFEVGENCNLFDISGVFIENWFRKCNLYKIWFFYFLNKDVFGENRVEVDSFFFIVLG